MNSGEVLKLAARHGGVTVEHVHKMLCPKRTVKSAEKMVAQERGHFRTVAFDGKRLLYIPNHKGRKLLGLPLKKKSEGERVVISTVIALNFFAANPERKRLTKSFFAERFPNLVISGLNATNLFIDPGAKLSWLLIDYGSEARRIVKKVRRLLARLNGDAWTSAIHNHSFYFTLIVPTEAKARTLDRLFKRYDLSVDLVTDPELRHLLGG